MSPSPQKTSGAIRMAEGYNDGLKLGRFKSIL
jgi:hypothetical protein